MKQKVSSFTARFLAASILCARLLGSSASEVPTIVATSANGVRVAYASADGRIKCSRTEDGSRSRSFYLCRARALGLSPDGRLIAALGNFNGFFFQLRVWDTDTGALVCKAETDFGAENLCFSGDNTFLVATARGSTLDLWNLQSHQERRAETLASNILHVAFQAHELVIVCQDGRVRHLILE